VRQFKVKRGSSSNSIRCITWHKYHSQWIKVLAVNIVHRHRQDMLDTVTSGRSEHACHEVLVPCQGPLSGSRVEQVSPRSLNTFALRIYCTRRLQQAWARSFSNMIPGVIIVAASLTVTRRRRVAPATFENACQQGSARKFVHQAGGTDLHR
jgi:hypothetical protein